MWCAFVSDLYIHNIFFQNLPMILSIIIYYFKIYIALIPDKLPIFTSCTFPSDNVPFGRFPWNLAFGVAFLQIFDVHLKHQICVMVTCKSLIQCLRSLACVQNNAWLVCTLLLFPVALVQWPPSMMMYNCTCGFSVKYLITCLCTFHWTILNTKTIICPGEIYFDARAVTVTPLWVGYCW